MAWIDNTIFQYKGNNLLVMLFLVTNMNEKGVCAVGLRTIAKEIGITYSAVREAIKRLEKEEAIAQNTAQFTAQISICNFESYTKPQRKLQRSLQRTQKEVLPLEERIKQFGVELIPYVDTQGGKYPAPMIRAFYDYWSEPNQTKTKMRFELQKTWNTAGRLATWANRNNIIIHDDDNLDDINNINNKNNNWQT